MFFLYKLLREGVTVVYEKVQANKVFVFPPTGECRVLSEKADAKVVPELESPKTVHLFDACARVNAHEPYLYLAKLAIFSPNETSYKQLLRSGVDFLIVPSYSRAELDKRRAYFPDVTDDAYQKRIEMFGCGSIRLVLGVNQERAAQMLALAINNTTVRNMLDIIQLKSNVDIGSHVLFTASLAEGADKSDISSYRRGTVSWNIASSYIMSELIRESKDEAMQFAERAATVFHDTPGLEATAGMFFENVVPLILAKGGTFRVRKLSGDVHPGANTLVQYALRIPVGSVHGAGVGGEVMGSRSKFFSASSPPKSGILGHCNMPRTTPLLRYSDLPDPITFTNL
eukprot:scaffold6548_cov231-Ochromonas_danica.AAC.1